MASYAMLLRSCPVALSSPRNGPASPGTSLDVRKSWREGIESPTEWKSFSFGRLSLLPALQKPIDNTIASSNCNVSEFLLAALSNFASHYLYVLSVSGDRPISRAKWEQDAEEDLKLQRDDAASQQQFHAWSGTTNVMQNSVPDAVDLLDRPDCMDDVIAFATSVCSLGPEYALNFWDKEETTVDDGSGALVLIPSRALLALRDQQSGDETLRASYLAFLAALALARGEDASLDGARTVHEMLSRQGATDSWQTLVEILRWYARELSPNSSSSSASSSGLTNSDSTAYYYFEGADSSSDGQTSMDQLSRRKTRELGEENSYLLLAHLALISNVARGCPVARAEILALNVTSRGSSNSNILEGQDSTLMVLFTLAVTALAPDVRGKVFCTLAELLNTDSVFLDEQQNKQIQECAGKAWELLEACQILPIHLLEQYSSASPLESQNVTGLAFPPSSTAMVC